MSARPTELTREGRPALRVIDGAGARSEGPEVVAEIMSDGTVRVDGRLQAGAPDHGFVTGQVFGEGWTIWWDRRTWSS
jgi:hypothetical protein